MTDLRPQDISFPPLLWGEEVRGNALDHAARRATVGCDAGLVVYALGPTVMEVALVFTPEVSLVKAMAMLPVAQVGFQNALGVLAPPEVAVHFTWGGGIMINGAGCGGFRVMSATTDADEIPDWMAVGFTLPLLPTDDDPGKNPDQTSLYSEGCADVAAPMLVEAFARHTLHWITRWEHDGTRPVHGEWRGLLHGVGEDAERGGNSGTFLGVDEDFGMLLRDADTTHLFPLTQLIGDAQ